jgi:hypothetical protein
MVKEVIKPERDLFAPVKALAIFGEAMELHDSVSKQSKYRKEHPERTVVL